MNMYTTGNKHTPPPPNRLALLVSPHCTGVYHPLRTNFFNIKFNLMDVELIYWKPWMNSLYNLGKKSNVSAPCISVLWKNSGMGETDVPPIPPQLRAQRLTVLREDVTSPQTKGVMRKIAQYVCRTVCLGPLDEEVRCLLGSPHVTTPVHSSLVS